MKELQTLQETINKALEKGVFTSCKDIATVLQALQSLAEKINKLENGTINTDN
jgi:hypothetical protein